MSSLRLAGAAALLAPLLAGLPAPARAQIGFEDLLESVTDIAVSVNCWSTRSESVRRSDCPGGKNGYGIEVLWGLKTVPLGRQPRVDTTWVPSGKTVTVRQGRPDTVTTLEMKEGEPKVPGYRVLIELGLGYSQFSGFTSADERFELRGTIREEPSLAFYASLEGPGIFEHVNPYAGIRTGLIRLGGVQAFTPEGDSTTAYVATAEAFQVGGALGVSVGTEVASLFLEAQLNLRRFTSVDWTAGAGGTIPGFLPRGLDFSGPSLSLGVQIHIRD
ncbi:MAG: hypothetical protein ACJ8GN_24570 [Longimicrobiaceae bacterium]